jgi:hypothetical protein
MLKIAVQLAVAGLIIFIGSFVHNPQGGISTGVGLVMMIVFGGPVVAYFAWMLFLVMLKQASNAIRK